MAAAHAQTAAAQAASRVVGAEIAVLRGRNNALARERKDVLAENAELKRKIESHEDAILNTLGGDDPLDLPPPASPPPPPNDTPRNSDGEEDDAPPAPPKKGAPRKRAKKRTTTKRHDDGEENDGDEEENDDGDEGNNDGDSDGGSRLTDTNDGRKRKRTVGGRSVCPTLAASNAASLEQSQKRGAACQIPSVVTPQRKEGGAGPKGDVGAPEGGVQQQQDSGVQQQDGGVQQRDSGVQQKGGGGGAQQGGNGATEGGNGGGQPDDEAVRATWLACACCARTHCCTYNCKIENSVNGDEENGSGLDMFSDEDDAVGSLFSSKKKKRKKINIYIIFLAPVCRVVQTKRSLMPAVARYVAVRTIAPLFPVRASLTS